VVVIPAIDLKDGRCVRLRQGDLAAETVYSEDVIGVARKWQECGAGLIHVVDLNGAVGGEPRNLPQIEAVLMDRAFLEQACAEFPRQIVLGLDARDGKVAVRGWTAVSDTRAIDLLNEVSGLAIRAVIYTDIARDGMLNGPNLTALKEVAASSAFPVIASGGISRIEDLLAVRSLGSRIEGAIVGKALYDGHVDYRAALTALCQE
jgi:phosphoribosylformimino-5-aminoimidazole carboxamide ribotide isomerase